MKSSKPCAHPAEWDHVQLSISSLNNLMVTRIDFHSLASVSSLLPTPSSPTLTQVASTAVTYQWLTGSPSSNYVLFWMNYLIASLSSYSKTELRMLNMSPEY